LKNKNKLTYSIKNIVVVGIGGVGGYFGGKLAKALSSDKFNERKITFVARGSHADAIKQNGLILEQPEETIICRPDFVTDDIEKIVSPDLVLLCTKSYDMEDIVQKLEKVILKNTIIIPLLNGVDICERIRKVTQKGIVLPSCVYICSNIERPGKVFMSGPQGAIISGAGVENNGFDPSELNSVFENTGFKFKWVDDPYQAIWEKYVYVASFAIITGYTNKTFNEVAKDDTLLVLLKDVMNEILALANALNIIFADGFYEKSVKRSASLAPEARTSFSRDLEVKGKQNEIDIFGYTIINKGKELGVQTPVTEKLVKEMEQRVKNKE
jgi:2-dehydropantoate 2-reductase